MMSQVESLFQYYQKRDLEEKELSEHSENSQNNSIKTKSSTNFNFFFLFLLLEQNKIVAKM